MRVDSYSNCRAVSTFAVKGQGTLESALPRKTIERADLCGLTPMLSGHVRMDLILQVAGEMLTVDRRCICKSLSAQLSWPLAMSPHESDLEATAEAFSSIRENSYL